MPHPRSRARFRRDVALLLAVLHFGTYAYFWQWRGWNESSRLILTYALVEQGTIAVDALHSQSSDIAYRNGHYYSYKPPGQSLLGVPIYAMLRLAGASHPRVPSGEYGREPRPLSAAAAMPGQLRHWWPDYVLTVATSGLATTLLVVLVYAASLRLGCSQLQAVLLACCYGLGTPAFTHATLYCGHQVAAFAGFASLLALWPCPSNESASPWRLFAAGLAAGMAVMAEYTMALTSVGLAVWAMHRAGGVGRAFWFLLPAIGCAVVLAIYNTSAFGSAWAAGYQYSVVSEYREIYTAENPSGLVAPSFDRACRILFSGRGLLWYAPVLIVAPWGLVRLLRDRQIVIASLSTLAFGSFFLVNVAHPTWEGGASTGPRYLLAAVPFLMPAIAALAARHGRLFCAFVAALGLWGFIVCLACTAIPEGGRLPHLGPGGDDPLRNLVVERLADGTFGGNVGNLLLYGMWTGPTSGNWWSLVPLLDFMAVAGGLLTWRTLRGMHARDQSECAHGSRLDEGLADGPPAEGK